MVLNTYDFIPCNSSCTALDSLMIILHRRLGDNNIVINVKTLLKIYPIFRVNLSRREIIILLKTD